MSVPTLDRPPAAGGEPQEPDGPDGPAAPAAGTPGQGRGHRGGMLPYLLVLPGLLAIAAVYFYPLYRTLVMSFQDYRRRHLWTGDTPDWVGFEQFTNVLTDAHFWAVATRTVVFMVVCVTLTVGGGLLIALIMQRMSLVVRLMVTAALVTAWAMPIVVATSVFRWLTDSEYGIVNILLSKLPGVDFRGHNWFMETWQGFAVVAAVVVWGAVPFVAVTLYAALTQVPKELEEAAHLDGAGGRQVFRHVVFPVIKPVFVLVTTLSVIWDFNVFLQIFLMRGNNVEPQYELLGIYSYNLAFQSQSFSQGTAVALITVLLLAGVAVYYLRQMMKRGEVE
ncbi:carbohydrate ABC transporter permease [Streptomyces spiramenti]|uniref:Sugar ABC transporter permease n=1 Tax=Streptomyces spiramenti TaxID=2720606 RepID=A0ABX1AHT8_9ACTN|nr:sugar ABC transporter permease [Streptomyces spiramenti]